MHGMANGFTCVAWALARWLASSRTKKAGCFLAETVFFSAS